MMLEECFLPGNDIPTPIWYSRRTANSYIHMKLYEILLRDRFMKTFYFDVLLKNKHLIKDRILLDLDGGAGLVAIMLSSLGAKAVISIEPSPVLAKLADRAIRANNVHNVFIIEGDVDKIESLPSDIKQVDVIVCQWMGFLLFDHQLLTSLIRARNRWLKPNGLLMPDSIRIFMVAAEHGNGFKKLNAALNFSEVNVIRFKKKILQLPKWEEIHTTKIKSDCVELYLLNLKTVSLENFGFSKQFELTLNQDSIIHIFSLFFDVQFTRIHKPVIISNSPLHGPSFWKHMTLYLNRPLTCCSGEKIRGTFLFNQSNDNHTLGINLKFNFFGCKSSGDETNLYLL